MTDEETDRDAAEDVNPRKRLAQAKLHITAAANAKSRMLRKKPHTGKQQETPEYFLEIFRQMMRNL